jgi:hypothetical protein
VDIPLKREEDYTKESQCWGLVLKCFALTNNNSRVMCLQLQERVNSKGILFTIYGHRTQPMRNYNHTPHKSLQQ